MNSVPVGQCAYVYYNCWYGQVMFIITLVWFSVYYNYLLLLLTMLIELVQSLNNIASKFNVSGFYVASIIE